MPFVAAQVPWALAPHGVRVRDMDEAHLLLFHVGAATALNSSGG